MAGHQPRTAGGSVRVVYRSGDEVRAAALDAAGDGRREDPREPDEGGVRTVDGTWIPADAVLEVEAVDPDAVDGGDRR